ncbi:MAG: hypothetical protein Q7R95_01490, partial [bacterium]|nr:hypothetical protein [bacterium]
MKNKKIDDKKRGKILLITFQILLLIGMSFAISYFISESMKVNSMNNDRQNYQEKNIGLSLLPIILKSLGKIIFGEKGFVSAEEDLSKGVYTCLKTKTGSICQEFTYAQCNQNCESESKCIPSSAEEVSQCKVGTCYDRFEGTCSVSAPK